MANGDGAHTCAEPDLLASVLIAAAEEGEGEAAVPNGACRAGALAAYSYKALDPGSGTCGVVKKFKPLPQQCVINPATGNQHCLALPEGFNISSDDVVVQEMKQRAFELDDTRFISR